MSVAEWVLVVLCDGLVEVEIFLFRDLRAVSEPDSFDFVDKLPLPDLFSDSLCGFLGGFFFSSFLFLRDLEVFLLSKFGLSLSLCNGIFILNFLANFLGKVEIDRVVDELGVLLNEILDFVLFYELNSVILQEQRNTCSTT